MKATVTAPLGSVEKNRNAILPYLGYGSFVVTLVFFCLRLIEVMSNGLASGGGIPLAGCVLALVATGSISLLLRRQQYAAASKAMVVLYGTATVSMAWLWGINLPYGLTLGCVTIIMSGMILGPRYILYTAATLISSLLLLQIGLAHNLYQPNLGHTARASTYSDVAAYASIYALLALMAWYFCREIHDSLSQAEQAKADLLQEKNRLESGLSERTAKLRVMQLEKVQQLHRFAELGQLSTAMMHELANHLTNLSFDIENLHGQHRSEALKRARHSLGYIDSMAKNVSKRLHDLPAQQPFNVTTQTKKVIKALEPQAAKLQVAVNLNLLYAKPPRIPSEPPERSKSADSQASKEFQAFGDTMQFDQVMTILITNAIEAYEEGTLVRRGSIPQVVEVRLTATDQKIIARIIDHGKGIGQAQRQLLFKPFMSTKKQGMGVGLYIAKSIITSQFKGTIRLSRATNRTEFVITLPRHT
jgi:signal transduction histidine kinase